MFHLPNLVDAAIVMLLDEREKMFSIFSQPLIARGLKIHKFRMKRYGKPACRPHTEYSFMDAPQVPQTVNYFNAVKKAMQHALDCQFKRVLFLEDDIVVRPELDDVLTRAAPTIEKVRWDMLYLGANRANALTHPYMPNLLQVRGALGFFAVILTPPAICDIMACGSSLNEGIDGIVGRTVHYTRKAYSVYPNVINQLPGAFSFAANDKSNYLELSQWPYLVGGTVKHVPLW